MTAADKIAAARALIEPLTGYAPAPWSQDHRHTGLGYATQVFPAQDERNTIATLAWHSVSVDRGGERTTREANARLIAAAPALRDTVAALADLAEAQAQENAKLRAALDPNLTKADYIGEFKQRVCFGSDEDGNEIWDDVTISWTVTKQIMAAIRARAALGETP